VHRRPGAGYDHVDDRFAGRTHLTRRGAVLGRVFASRTLRRVALAFLGFSCAEHGVWVAMIVYAYQQGGTTEAAVIAVVQLLPAAAVAPWASRLADRRGGAVGLFVGYVVQALAMGVTAALLFLDAPAAAAYAGAVVAASAVTLTRPAQAALVPTLVEEPAELTAANAVIGWIESISLFVGPALTGVLIGLSGPAASFTVFGVAVAGSALLVAGIARRAWGATGGAPTEEEAADRGVIAALRAQPGAAALLGVCSIQFVAYGALDVLIVVLAVELLSLGASGAGYLNAAFGVGGIAGGMGTLWLIGREHLAPPLVAAVLAWGLAFFMIGVLPSVIGAFLLFAVAGAAWTMLDVAGRTLLQRAMPPDVRGRVFGMLEGLSMLSLALGSLLVPALAALGGPRVAVGGIGALLILVAVGSFRLVRNLDRAAAPVAQELELVRASPLFNMLSAPVLEDLARSLVPVHVPAGEEFLREGEAGERFYLVSAGRASVSARGRQVAELDAGDGFGEIALLRDGIRTSTVTSLEPLSLYALDRRPFLAAVTGSMQAERAAHEMAAERLSVH
jgi:MFS family permease